MPDPYVLATASIDAAIDHLSERKSFFSIPTVMKSARLMSVLPSSDGDFLKIIEQKIKNKDLIYTDDTLLTTPHNLSLEAKNGEMMLSSKGSVDKMLVGWIFDLTSHFFAKTEAERRALKFMLTTSDRQILVTSSGKPLLYEVLRTFNTLCKNQGYYPRVLTENAATVELLKKKLNTDRVMTLEGFLLFCEARGERRNPNPNILARWDRRVKARAARDVWIVSGEVSFNHVNRLQHWSTTLGARLIFTQTRYVDIPALNSLKNNGMSHCQITIPQYYQEELNVKAALLRNIDRLEAKHALQSINDAAKRVQGTVEQALAQAALPRLLTLSHAEGIALNEAVRIGLIAKGELGSNEPAVMLPILQALGLSVSEKSQPHLYQPGDIIRFNCEQPGTAIQKGSYGKVETVDLSSGFITLNVFGSHTSMTWDPAIERNFKKIDVFRMETREIRVGETLVWTRTLQTSDKTFSRIKNQSARVLAVVGNQISVRLQNGKRILLDGQDVSQQHWDHGYAVTLKNMDWKTSTTVLLILQHDKIDCKTLVKVQELLEHQKDKQKSTTLICDDVATVKQVIKSGGMGFGLPTVTKEAPYNRAEALSKHQTTVTQQIFYGLQEAYLQVKQLNPEFLPHNLDRVEKESYSPEFRAACDVVDKVCLYHGEREAVLNLKTLTLEAAQLGGLRTSIENIERAFEVVIHKGWLVVVPNPWGENAWVTLRFTLLMEKFCVQKMQMGKNQLVPIITEHDALLKNLSAQEALTRGQRNAIVSVLSTRDRFAAIQGIAGAGKTTALREIDKHCKGRL